MGDTEGSAPLRMAELLAALSLGIDLGFAQPMEHVLRQCRIALGVCDLAGLGADDRAATYYAALLVNVGCHTDSHEQARWFGDDLALRATKYLYEPFSVADMAATLRLIGSGSTPLHRLRVGLDLARNGRAQVDGMINGHARLARSLGEELGLAPLVLDALGSSYERWDGKGYPGVHAGVAIPIAARVVQLAEFLEVAHRTGGADAAIEVAERRAGKQFDPALVELFTADVEKVFHGIDELDSWDAVLDAEPALGLRLSPGETDAALLAVARFVDLKSPFTLGHSEAVAALSAAAGGTLGASRDELRTSYRAALVAGFGRLAVSNAIWDKAGPLTAADWERVRLHPHMTERMVHQSPALAPLGRVAVQLRERLDGSGYPRGASGAAISQPGRILAAADVYRSLREPRPHRPAFTAGEAETRVRAEVRAGRLDGGAVEAVLNAAGHRRARRTTGPAGLTAREVEVLRLAARGLSNKEIGARLVISPKTAGNHIEHIYTKIGASNRAEASLFAMRHGLVDEPDQEG